MFLDKIYLKMSKSGLAPIFSLEASMTCKTRTILNPWCQKKVVTMYTNSDKATSDNVLTLKHCLVVATVVASAHLSCLVVATGVASAQLSCLVVATGVASAQLSVLRS